jgi:DedD protein
MARAISDEEIQLKRRARRRLIGAIVLVMAIIVVLPMVLDSEPKPADQEIKVQIPSTESGAFSSKVVPVPPKAEVKPAPKASDAAPAPSTAPDAPKEAPKEAAKSTPAVPAEKPAVVKEAAKEAPKEAPKEAAKPEAPKPALKAETELAKAAPAKPAAKPATKSAKPAAKESAKTADGKFVVQVIALADADRARQMQGKIAAAGIKSYTEVVKTAKGDVTRVRAGPFATRQQAEKAHEQLKALGMSGNIATK